LADRTSTPERKLEAALVLVRLTSDTAALYIHPELIIISCKIMVKGVCNAL
jgi:hypothetical protein